MRGFLTFIFKLLILIAVVSATVSIAYIGISLNEIVGEKDVVHVPTQTPTVVYRERDVDFDDKFSELRSYVDLAVSTVSGQTETIIEREVLVESEVDSGEDAKSQTAIVSITGGYSTQSADWVNLSGTEFEMDLANDYSADAIIKWEGFIYEQHGNGKAVARIFDTTNGIAVDGGEISTNMQTLQLVRSANMNIWSGRNNYVVQLKSQIGFPVYFESGRLIISY